jgi:NDP-sugar pyrophosphorylase family protein
MLGQSLIEYWLCSLARNGTEQVLVAASDGAEEVRRLVGDGSRWGIKAAVRDEARPLNAAEAMIKYAAELGPTPDRTTVLVLNHFPGHPDRLLFGGPAEFMAGLLAWMPQALTPDRVGVREIRPGVWTGVNATISPGARLEPPCWVGQHALIEEEATIGPNTIIEDGVVVETTAEIQSSWIGPRTLVGQFTQIQDSVAWGNRLVNWKTGAETTVPDPFVLCALEHPRVGHRVGLLARAVDLYRRNKERVPFFMEPGPTAKGIG